MTSRKTRQYVGAAVESLTLAIELFNRPSPLGREHATVMMAAHAFEMLLKAVIYEQRKKVKFAGSDRRPRWVSSTMEIELCFSLLRMIGMLRRMIRS